MFCILCVWNLKQKGHRNEGNSSLRKKLYFAKEQENNFGKQHTTPPTMTTPIEVREVSDATLVAMATIRSSWVMRAVSLLGGAIVEGGPEDGVRVRGNAGREAWVKTEEYSKTDLLEYIVFIWTLLAYLWTLRRILYLEVLVHQFERSLCINRSQEAVD